MFRSAAFVSLVLGILLTGVLVGVHSAPADQGGIPHVQGEVILKFKDNASQAEKNQVRTELGGSHLKGFGRIKAELRRLGPELTVEEAVARYRNHPKVEYIEPNYIITLDETPNDPRFSELWGMENTGQTGGTPGADISATNAWDVFTGSSSVLIGVIDTGVDYTHPDLAANIWVNPGEIAGNGIDDDMNGYIDDVRGWDFYNDDNDPMDDHGHGSHVSGTIGGVGNNGIGVAGVSWTVKIMPLKFLSAGGSGSTADAVDAVDYATMMGVHLTSNSWGGGGYSQALYDAINAANTAGQLFVAAAGNSGANTDVSPHYPSSYTLPNIVSVAATDHNDLLASFSNYGATSVDLAAPGVNILSTFPGNTYGSISGTSMATPHVSGALGLVFGRFPAIGHLDAKNLIYNFVDPLPNLSGVVATGGRLNAFFPIADPDSIPPGAVTDLAVSNAGSNWLTADWSAPGDDGYTGTASRYVVKYSLSPITPANFDMAMTAPNPPDPDPVGSPQQMTISGLDFSTPYYIALKALDEFGNASGISNVASGVTLGAPDIDVTPTSLTETLLSGATATQTLTLYNVLEGTLDFEIPLPDLITTAPVQAAYVPIGKGEVDARTGDPVIEGTGGPDGFGYRWVDSDEPFGPAFSWNDISGTGTLAISTGDDTNQGPFPIGFSFSFYGVEYTTFRVCSNGFLSLTSSSTAYDNQPLPNAGAPFNLIAPFWDDLNPTVSGNVYYESDGNRLIVQWDNVAHYGSGGPYTFQAILESDGTILFQYLSMGTPDNSATVGMQNATGTDALQVAFNTAYVHNNLAVRIQAVPQWVTVSPTSGTVLAGNSTTLTVTFNSGGLLGGDYDANIRVLSNDPDEPVFTVPAALTVIGAPDIAVAPSSHDFGPVFIGATPSEEILIQNPGTDSLHVTGLSVDDPVYSLDLSAPFTVPPRQNQPVNVTFAPVAVASYPATMTVLSDDPDEPSVTVSLNGQGVVPPDFSVSPTSLSSNLLTGETETQVLTLSNSGGADLEWSLGVEFIAASQLFTLTAPEPAETTVDVDTGSPDAVAGRTTPIQAELNDLTGVDIMWDRSHGQSSTSSWTTIIADFESRGATVTENTDPITPGLLAGYEILWSSDLSSSFDAAEMTALVDWMNAGGGLLLEGDNSSSVTIYNEILTALGAGVTYSTTSGSSGTSTNIYEHPTTENVAGIYLTGNIASIPAAVAPGGFLFDDDEGLGAGAYSEVGAGRVVAVSDEIFQNSRMDDADNQLFGNQVMDWLAGNAFLSVSPTSGVVPPGGSTNIDVVFDATDLFGGLYQADINIETNDPLAPLVTVPAELQVTGAPDLTLDPTSTDFGDVYVGYPDIHEFEIFNAGTDLLTVTSIASDAPEFTVFLGSGSFPINLTPRASTVIQVRFSPSAPGAYSGTLTVYSNDPDTPQALFGVAGSGLLPPVASVSPTSLHADLLTNETETQQFTLSNTGATDLNWETQLAFTTVSSYTLAGAVMPTDPDADGGVSPAGFSTDPVQITAADLTGVNIMWDRAHGQTSTSSWTTIIGDLEARGATVTVNNDPFTPALLMGYDVIWSVDTGSSATFEPDELAALAGWINGGGGLLLEGDNASSVADYNDILTALAAGIEYSTTSGSSGVTTNIYPHATTADVFEIYLTANVASIPTIAAPGAPLFDDDTGVGAGAYSQVGAGRIVCVSDEVFQNSRMGANDNRLFGNQVMDWLATPVFLSVDPDAGVVPPGGSTVVDVTFDAGGLFGGDYNAVVRVLSNDPANGEIDVAASMTVTGVPRVEWEPEPLDFGDVFLAYPDTMDLTVSNTGTDDLIITAMTPDLLDWKVKPESLTLLPLETALVSVILDPQAVGDRSTTLTIESNDPASPHTANLVGTGLLPPAASVSPTSIHSDLLTGETELHQLTLSNTGDSDLFWEGALLFDAPVLSMFTLTAPEPYQTTNDVDTGSPDPVGGRTEPIQAELNDLTGVQIMWDRSHGQTSTSLWTTIIADFESRGATVTVNTDPFTPTLLAGYNVIWSVDTGSSDVFTPDELAALAAWINNGGGLLLEGDNSSSVADYNDILTALGAGITYSTTSGSSGTTTNIYEHPTTENVTGIYLSANVASIPTVESPGGFLFDDDEGVGAGAFSEVGGGRIVAIADEVFQNSRMDNADNQLFGNQVMDWLNVPAFMTMSPEAGTVPAGGSQLVDVTYDAAGLYGGDYSGLVRFLSNDPMNPVIDVTATLHVTPVPRIAWEPAFLDYGDVFIGYPSDLTLTVTNVGTDVLSVTGMTAGLDDYSVDPPSFNLDPLESQDVLVTFDPQAPGIRNTDLSVTSNDPDSPHLVPLAGVGVVPPVAVASPDTVEGAAMVGGSKTKTLTLCNTGGSDLIWSAGASADVVQVHEYLELPKQLDEPGSIEPVDPRPSIRGTGGPDLFGYTWIDSDEPGGPVFDWVDISETGNPTDFPPYDLDGTFGPYPIGFDFPYYENSFSEFYICSNGWISFTNGTLESYSNQPLPNSGSAVPENMLAIWWDDNVYDESDDSYIKYLYDGTRLIIEYHVRRIAQFSPPWLNFEIILYPNGDIVYQYNSLGPTISSSTIGWQNAAKDDGQTIIHNDGSYPHTDLAILISAAPPWLSVSPESGVLPAGECAELQVLMDAAELEEGDYTGSIDITSNDPANPVVSSDVLFHVGTIDAADFDVDPNTVNLGAVGNYVSAYVELPLEYDPADVLVETVLLNGTVPADPNFFDGEDWNENGIPDLGFKFDRYAVQAILDEGDSVEVTVTGEIEDTIYFTATDYVRVIRPQMMSPNGGEILMAGTWTTLQWANPIGWEVDHATLTFSSDGGDTWELIADDVTGESHLWQVPSTATETGHVRVYVSDALGVMGSDTSDEPFTISGGVVGAENFLPTSYALLQNAPNPFQVATRITFDLPEEASARLTVFDVSGRAIRTIETGQLPPGRHETVWDGRTDGGRDVAAGIYFYRLETPAFSATRRMILVR